MKNPQNKIHQLKGAFQATKNLPINLGEFREFMKTNKQSLKKIVLHKLFLDHQIMDVLTEFELRKLEILNLYGCKIQEPGVQKFFTNEWPSLESINMGLTNVGDRHLQKILTSPLIQKIKYLNLGQIISSPDGIVSFVSAKLLCLKHLFLNQNEIGKRGVELLVKSHIPQLKCLVLFKSGLTNKSVKTLSKASWPKLKKLHIQLNQGLTPQCLVDLEESNWKELKMLNNSFTHGPCIFYSAIFLRSNVEIEF